MKAVAPRAGAWIETRMIEARTKDRRTSRPARARGLKLLEHGRNLRIENVAPRAGAWIETLPLIIYRRLPNVAPRAGAWIETSRTRWAVLPPDVAPRAGAWIETRDGSAVSARYCGRAPRGRVD